MGEDLLVRHCRLATDDLDEGYSAVQAQWEKHCYSSFRGPYALRWHQFDLQGVGLSYVTMGYSAHVSCQPRIDCFRLLMPEAGRIGHRVNGCEAEATPAHAVVHGPGQELELEISPNRLLFLTLTGEIVRRAAEKRYGSAAPLSALPPQLPLDAPAAATLRSLIQWTAREADRPDSVLQHSAPSRLHLQSTMVSLFLDCLDWARPELPRGREHVAEARIRRIEDWMDAHLADDVGIEDFAACVGLSVRAVQVGFRRLRNCTPTQAFIRRRLQRVRRLLEDPAPQTSVTKAATECGFVQLGRFAARYRDAFGETPRETLARARRRT